MTDRSTAYEGNQIGLEAANAPGVAVPANRRLSSLELAPSTATETQEFGPRGSKYNTVVLNNKVWTEAPITGVGSFTDLMYPFGVMYGFPTPTTPTGGTLARQHVFNPKTFEPDSGRTLTVETGSSVYAERFVNGIINSFGLTFNRNGVSVSGQFLGQLTEEAITLTANPTKVAHVPMAADEINIYADYSAAALGTTQLLRAMELSFGLNDRHGTVWPMNRSKKSFDGVYEKKPTAEAGLILGADAAGMALKQDMLDEKTLFLRVEVLGPVIEAKSPGPGNINYTFMLDLAVKILNPEQKGDEDQLLTQPYALRIVHDDTWGQAMRATFINKIVTP